MLGVYLAALIVGGGLLLLSLAGGHGHDLHAGGHDAHGSGHDAHGHHDVRGGGSDFLALFASLRFWTFFLASGGLTGLILRVIGLAEPIPLAVAVADGFGLGLAAALLFRRMSTEQLSSARSTEDWIGKTGKVTIPVSAAHPGKIRLELDDEVVDLIARAAEAEGELPVGEEVMIVEMDDDTALVSRAAPGKLPGSKPALSAGNG